MAVIDFSTYSSPAQQQREIICCFEVFISLDAENAVVLPSGRRRHLDNFSKYKKTYKIAPFLLDFQEKKNDLEGDRTYHYVYKQY